MSPPSAFRRAAEAMLALLTPERDLALPAEFDSALIRLEESTWPQVVVSWSRLTPSGFPVEVTALPDGCCQWAAEVAGPELPETARLSRALALLDDAGQPVAPAVRRSLLTGQSGRELRFGAWLGGCGPDLKLYAELPGGLGACRPGLPLPGPLAAGLTLLPRGTLCRMYGDSPARRRGELYFRLPDVEAVDLLPFLRATGHSGLLDVLRANLPDGLRRLSGRRLGLSISWKADESTEPTLIVSARTLFPGHPAGLLQLAPQLSVLGAHFGGLRPCGVTLASHPTRFEVLAAVGLCPLGPA
ncbi:hypothetical protein [Streptomyces phaeofaciens]|uniref:hypothetical protein n=1 Tax=Streptomyces phaeofaciens TaxID=68254 RepID=UPI003685738C